MPTPRETRLMSEFQGLKALRTAYCLFDFFCANLSAEEARGLVMQNLAVNLSGFLTPEEFERINPGIPPEKYLIHYTCTGLELLKDGTKRKTSDHLMEVIFSWDYPAERPEFIWLTPIWHPNFRVPHICIYGRPFAVGLNLTQIVPEVGRLVQYQSYNTRSALNHEAAEWVRENPHLLPIDKRDLLDYRRLVERRPQASGEIPFVEVVDEELPNEQLIEIVESDAE